MEEKAKTEWRHYPYCGNATFASWCKIVLPSVLCHRCGMAREKDFVTKEECINGREEYWRKVRPDLYKGA